VHRDEVERRTAEAVASTTSRFLWTDPPIPQGWHGVIAGDDTGKGTIVDSHI